MDLLALLSDNGISLQRKASTHGGEYAGPCPFCAGSDRFRVWPRKGERGRWWCRQCDRAGDDIDLLKEWKGMSYKEACEALGVEVKPLVPRNIRASAPEPVKDEPDLAVYKDPPEKWKEQAGLLLQQSIDSLWSDRGVSHRQWLRDERGLQLDTVDEGRLGIVLEDAYFDRKAWGLPVVVNEETGRKKKIWIPAGLIIPCFSDGELCRLRVRRFSPGDGGRYIVIPGSSSRPLSLGLTKAVICIVESELDGFLLWQEAGEMVGVVALGAARMKPDQALDERLGHTLAVLGCLDFDEAGGRGSWAFWARRYANFKRWPCPVGKDPGEAWKKGTDIKVWIRAGLPWGATSQDRL